MRKLRHRRISVKPLCQEGAEEESGLQDLRFQGPCSDTLGYPAPSGREKIFVLTDRHFRDSVNDQIVTVHRKGNTNEKMLNPTQNRNASKMKLLYHFLSIRLAKVKFEDTLGWHGGKERAIHTSEPAV